MDIKDLSWYNESGTSLIQWDLDPSVPFEKLREITLRDTVTELKKDSIKIQKAYEGIVILPKGVNRLPEKAFIGGNFATIDFTGGLTELSEGVLDETGEYTLLRINGLLGDMTPDSRAILRKWLEKEDYRGNRRKIIFAAPEACHTKYLGNGMVQLSKVLSTDDKMREMADTTPIVLNAFVNMQQIATTGEGVPIIIESVTIPKEDGKFYDDTRVTRIQIIPGGDANDRPVTSILVHETVEQVLELLSQASDDFFSRFNPAK